ncbi:MAG: hypothetical protein AAF439_07655 [Pseudomonadota bacterium]
MLRTLITAAALAFGGQALADSPKALILDITGEIEPAVEAFDELPAGQTLTLSPGAEISMTFYPTCEDVSIRGGIISITENSMTIDGDGEVTAYAKGECPGNVKLAASDLINAAIITRSNDTRPAISLRPTIAVIGRDISRFKSVAVYSLDNQLVQEVPLEGRKAKWPLDVAPLTDGGEYLLVVKGEEVQMQQAKILAAADAPQVIILRQ